jgi:uncharacterized membrane protein YczE
VIHISGFIMVSLGVVGIIYAGLGASPIDAFNYFMFVITPLSLGTMAVLTGLVVALIGFIFDRKKDILLSISFLFLVGVFIDFWKYLFDLLPSSLFDNLMIQIPLSLSSLIVIAIGTAMTITTGLSVSPYERLMNVIDRKIHSIRYSKMIIEGTFFLIAILLGILTKLIWTQVNIMTVMMVLFNGPLVQYFQQKILNQKRKEVIRHATK